MKSARPLAFIAVLYFSHSFNLQSQSDSSAVSVSKIGISINLAWSDALGFDMMFGKQDRFHIGATFQFSGAKGKQVSEILPNYGKTFLGEGEYYWTLDFGYFRK